MQAGAGLLHGDNEEMLAKLAMRRQKGYDMVFPTAFAVNTLIKQNRLQPLNKSKLPNWKNLNPSYLKLNAPFDPGNQYAAPTVVSLTVLGYNYEQLKKAGVYDKVGSWAICSIQPYWPRSKARSPYSIRSVS